MAKQPKPKYKRIVLKLSGEMLCSPEGLALDAGAMLDIAGQIKQVAQMGVQVGLVIGGGNFLRGRDLSGNKHVERSTADYMGMLATMMNGLAIRDTLESIGQQAAVLSPLADPRICEPFSRRRALELLEAGYVVLLAGGTGSPYFTTDTCAALRACEIGADVLLKATKVDGVFDSDPVKNPLARKYDRLTYEKVLADQLGVMDMTAVTLCRQSSIPIVVFAVARKGSLADVVAGRAVGTAVGF
jgi:uridylate kinase